MQTRCPCSRVGHAGAGERPGVVIAAPASGSGKTTVATGLMGALRRAGHRVAPFKVGPDFIDPGYHALAARPAGPQPRPGAGGRGADRPAVPARQRGRRHRGRRGRDGPVRRAHRATTSPAPRAGSTAHVAALLGAPVILVVDARGQSHSIAALLHGFSTFDHSRSASPGSSSTGSARPGTRRCCGRPASMPVCRCSARSRGPTNWPSRQGISAWSPPSSTASRRGPPSRR